MYVSPSPFEGEEKESKMNTKERNNKKKSSILKNLSTFARASKLAGVSESRQNDEIISTVGDVFKV
jgi:hypothetical protein